MANGALNFLRLMNFENNFSIFG